MSDKQTIILCGKWKVEYLGFKEYDRWWGHFIDRKTTPPTHYICPFPCFVFKIQRLTKEGDLLK